MILPDIAHIIHAVLRIIHNFCMGYFLMRVTLFIYKISFSGAFPMQMKKAE